MSDLATAKPADHAGVWMPPPLIYLACFGLGMAMHQLTPLAIPPVIPARLAALVFLGAGAPLLIWSNVLFQRSHTSRVTIRPATALVLRGPYQLTRNPMYLGLLCVYIAAALWFGVVWALIFTPLLVLVVQRLVIGNEERYLEQKFGEAYRQYRARVRRWI
jgi:protein-S-isoprenylcysteine O-methyltransferase Ste14